MRLDLVDMLGSGYVMEHCVSAFSDEVKDKIYRTYITDGIMNISESIAQAFGGRYLTQRYVDIIDTSDNDEETADEIVQRVIKEAELKINGLNETKSSSDA